MRYSLSEIRNGTGFAEGTQFERVEDYNGWTNRETWAVALHINNDQGWQESVLELVRAYVQGYDDDGTPNDAGRIVGDIIRENVEETLSPWDGERGDGESITLSHGQWCALTDIGSLYRVNWDEIGAAFLSDLDES